MQLLSGQTLKPSMHDHFVDKWISLVGDSRANLSATQVDERVLMTLATCSQALNVLYPNADQGSSSLKMSKGLFQQSMVVNLKHQFSNMSWSDWRAWITQQRQEYSVRRKSAPPTDEEEYLSSVFPTMTVSDAFGSRRKTAKKAHWQSHDGTTLTDAVNLLNFPTPTGIHADRGNHDEPLENYEKRVKDYEEGKTKGKPGKSLGVATRMLEKNWATPNTMDSMPQRSEEALKNQARGERKGRKHPCNLREQVDERAVEIYKKENWSTPQARYWKDTPGTSLQRLREGGEEGGTNGQLPLEAHFQHDQKKSNTTGKHLGLLNPDWVENLMGLPLGWTDLGCWGTV